jgi:hypothetical protein
MTTQAREHRGRKRDAFPNRWGNFTKRKDQRKGEEDMKKEEEEEEEERVCVLCVTIALCSLRAPRGTNRV